MCGVPYHSCEAYIARLIKKGYKVAICEQLEDPALAKGVVRRDVIRVVTPGTVLESSMLDEGVNNYIAGIFCEGGGFGVCFVDISTGEIEVTQYIGKDFEARLIDELGRFSPSEVVFSQGFLDLKKACAFVKERLAASASVADDDAHIQAMCDPVLCRHFGVQDREALGLQDKSHAACALSLLLEYLYDTQKLGLERLREIHYYEDDQFMRLDITARSNLELVETMRTGEKRGSLLWVLDKTKTAMGKRMIRTYLEKPLVNPATINKRLNAVEELCADLGMRSEVQELLGGVFDLERLMSRVVYGNVTPRELKSLEFTASKLPALKAAVAHSHSADLQQIFSQLDPLEDLHDRIAHALVDEPPITMKDGGAIAHGYNERLDELRDIVENTKAYLTKIEAEEREKTGIKKLKIGYNRVFGYYIEVTRSNADNIPEHYIRKQTLANCERYITPELKELENKILSAHESILRLEVELFDELRQFVSAQLVRTQRTASAVARLDVLCSFAQVAQENDYVRPDVVLSDEISIKDGRHPVVEKIFRDVPFVANDVYLNTSTDQVLVITGPNMAGKSTYMRQVALITLMAQIGSFVPAASAKIGVVDGIYTRVGASDDLTSGRSTFMVEMSEVANILKNATRNSLLILDEIGRGTSTFDGMSIARAVIEYIADRKKLGAKTLFATHYHELTDLEEQLEQVKNYNIAVKKRGDDITFLRRIVRGGADDSYGIEVSKLAGIPDSIIRRAHEILTQIEAGQAVDAAPSARPAREQAPQMEQMTFGSVQPDPIRQRLETVDVDTLTPIEALNLLYELKRLER